MVHECAELSEFRCQTLKWTFKQSTIFYFQPSEALNTKLYFMCISESFEVSAMVIFCTQGLSRPGPPFKAESDPLHISIFKLVFKLATSLQQPVP